MEKNISPIIGMPEGACLDCSKESYIIAISMLMARFFSGAVRDASDRYVIIASLLAAAPAPPASLFRRCRSA
jgi:hypothetical protein